MKGWRWDVHSPLTIHQQSILTTDERRKEETYFSLVGQKTVVFMVSVITWQTIYLNGIIHSFDLAKANMHVAEEKSVTHKTQNTRRAFLCVTDKRDNCSTYFLPDTRCIINMSAIFNLFLSDTFLNHGQ